MKKRIDADSTTRLTQLARARMEQYVAPKMRSTNVLQHFNSTWRLHTVECRTDSGKFVSTGWLCNIQGQSWMIVIGLHSVIQTAFPWNAGTRGRTRITTEGSIYDHVEAVNQKLMDDVEEEPIDS